jgi:hypothetical protein
MVLRQSLIFWSKNKIQVFENKGLWEIDPFGLAKHCISGSSVIITRFIHASQYPNVIVNK